MDSSRGYSPPCEGELEGVAEQKTSTTSPQPLLTRRGVQRFSNFVGGVVLAQQGVLNDFFKDTIGRIFNFGTPGSSPAASQTAAQLVTNVLQILLLVAGSIAVVYMVIGGIKYVLSRGNEEKVESAKATMGAAIWGLVIIIMSFAIIYIISEALISGETGIPTQ